MLRQLNQSIRTICENAYRLLFFLSLLCICISMHAFIELSRVLCQTYETLVKSVGKEKVMLKYSIKRIILALITAFIILTLTFFLVKSLPPTGVISPDEHVRFAFYAEQVDFGYAVDLPEKNDSLGAPLESFLRDGVWHHFYTKPIVDQYFSWLGNIVTKWDWGRYQCRLIK